MISYSQCAGAFALPDGTVLDGCYSGGGVTGREDMRNNSAFQSTRNLGPLPQGQYTISPAHTVPGKGPCVMALTPRRPIYVRARRILDPRR